MPSGIHAWPRAERESSRLFQSFAPPPFRTFPLRIGILSPSFPPNREPCGVGDFTSKLVPGLIRCGAEVVVLTGLDDTGPDEAGGASVVRVARKWGPGSLLKIARAVRERELDALLVQYAPDLYLCMANSLSSGHGCLKQTATM